LRGVIYPLEVERQYGNILTTALCLSTIVFDKLLKKNQKKVASCFESAYKKIVDVSNLLRSIFYNKNY
jgi:hypothetical protein